MEDLDSVPGIMFVPGLVLVFCSHLESEPVDGGSLCHPLSLCDSAVLINKRNCYKQIVNKWKISCAILLENTFELKIQYGIGEIIIFFK